MYLKSVRSKMVSALGPYHEYILDLSEKPCLCKRSEFKSLSENLCSNIYVIKGSQTVEARKALLLHLEQYDSRSDSLQLGL